MLATSVPTNSHLWHYSSYICLYIYMFLYLYICYIYYTHIRFYFELFSFVFLCFLLLFLLGHSGDALADRQGGCQGWRLGYRYHQMGCPHGHCVFLDLRLGLGLVARQRFYFFLAILVERALSALFWVGEPGVCPSNLAT